MEPFLGQIAMFGFNFAPRDWVQCDGQLLPIASNEALFSLLGTIYGGDGRTTFGLPDLRGRAPIGEGRGPGLTTRNLGSSGGRETNQLTVSQMPSHNHATISNLSKIEGKSRLKIADGNGNSFGSAGAYLAERAWDKEAKNPIEPYFVEDIENGVIATFTNNNTLKGLEIDLEATSGGLSIDYTGGNQPVDNMQPYLAVNYCISLKGIFPPRS